MEEGQFQAIKYFVHLNPNIIYASNIWEPQSLPSTLFLRSYQKLWHFQDPLYLPNNASEIQVWERESLALPLHVTAFPPICALVFIHFLCQLLIQQTVSISYFLGGL